MRINFTQLYYILDAFFFYDLFMEDNKEENDEKCMLRSESTFQKYSYYFIYFQINRDK